MQALGWNPRVVRQVWLDCGVDVKNIECFELKDGLLVNGDWYVAGFFRGDLGSAVVVGLEATSSISGEPVVRSRVKQSQDVEASAGGTSGSAMAAGSDQLYRFLDAVGKSAGHEYCLQLITNSLPLHVQVLLWNRSTDAGKVQVFSAYDAATWDDLIDQLIGVMEEKWWICGAHDRGDGLAEAVYDRSPAALVWRSNQRHAREEAVCSCYQHRLRLMMPSYMSEWAMSLDDRGRWLSCKCNDLKRCLHCCYRRYRNVVRRVNPAMAQSFWLGSSDPFNADILAWIGTPRRPLAETSAFRLQQTESRVETAMGPYAAASNEPRVDQAGSTPFSSPDSLGKSGAPPCIERLALADLDPHHRRTHRQEDAIHPYR